MVRSTDCKSKGDKFASMLLPAVEDTEIPTYRLDEDTSSPGDTHSTQPRASIAPSVPESQNIDWLPGSFVFLNVASPDMCAPSDRPVLELFAEKVVAGSLGLGPCVCCFTMAQALREGSGDLAPAKSYPLLVELLLALSLLLLIFSFGVVAGLEAISNSVRGSLPWVEGLGGDRQVLCSSPLLPATPWPTFNAKESSSQHELYVARINEYGASLTTNERGRDSTTGSNATVRGLKAHSRSDTVNKLTEEISCFCDRPCRKTRGVSVL